MPPCRNCGRARRSYEAVLPARPRQVVLRIATQLYLPTAVPLVFVRQVFGREELIQPPLGNVVREAEEDCRVSAPFPCRVCDPLLLVFLPSLFGLRLFFCALIANVLGHPSPC